jgi:hypothetical protein
VRSSVATGALRDAAQEVGALQADVNGAALDVPPAVLTAARPLDGDDVAQAVEHLADAVAGALGDLADALLGLRRGLEAAAGAYDAGEENTNEAYTSRPTLAELS